jgi:methyl-accepting chemotaxis protein
VRSAIEAMGRIEESSNRVVEIIGVVEQIAFQTNLLALNAAVEAARAGAAGKGFAVVAGEVRSLAQRVTQASKEINALVADAVTNVKLGSELVHKSGEVLDQTAESFGRVARLVDQIADSTSQQASGLRDVTGAVSELDRTTQQQLEMAEQGFGTARSLLAQADQLVAEVGYFKTKTPAAAAAPSAVPAPEAPASKPLPRTAAKPASPSLASKQAPTKPARAAPAPPMRRSLPGSAKG